MRLYSWSQVDSLNSWGTRAFFVNPTIKKYYLPRRFLASHSKTRTVGFWQNCYLWHLLFWENQERSIVSFCEIHYEIIYVWSPCIYRYYISYGLATLYLYSSCVCALHFVSCSLPRKNKLCYKIQIKEYPSDPAHTLQFGLSKHQTFPSKLQ